MKTWILEKRECSLDRWELAKLRRQNIDALCCFEDGLTPEELYRTTDKDEAMAKLAECKNGYGTNGSLWGFEEYVVAEGEVDEDGDFNLEGYWTTDSYEKYEALRGGNILNHQMLWYAVQEDEEDEDWCTGSFDKDEAIEMARKSGATIVAVIKENFLWGDEIGCECVEELHAGEDF